MENGDIVLVRTGYVKYWMNGSAKCNKAADAAMVTNLRLNQEFWLQEPNA